MQTREVLTPGLVSDDALLAEVARGDSDALEALYDRHAPAVFAISLKVVGDRASAEDVLQETFWRVWRSARTFEPQRGSFTSWLFRIARNLAIDAFRRRNVRPAEIISAEDPDLLLDQVSDPNANVADQAQSAIDNRSVRNALATLPQVQRQVIELAYYYGMTRQEIADVTGEALGTIHTRARLGLQKLREELDRNEYEG